MTVVVATLITSWRMTPIYESKTRLEVRPVSLDPNSDGTMTAQLETATLPTQVELIKSETVLSRAAGELELPSTKELKDSLEVELIRETQVIEIRVEHERPEEARDWAKAVAAAYLGYRQDRAIEQVVTINEQINRQIEDVKAQISEQDKLLSDLKGTALKLRQQRDKEAAELKTMESQLSAPQPSPAPPSSSQLARIERQRVRIADLDRQIADYESGGSGPKAERESMVSRLAVIESQRQQLPHSDLLQRGGGSVIAPANLPLSAARPNVPLNLTLAFVIGLMLAIGLAFLAENLDDKVRSPEEIEQRVGAPILGYIPFVKDWAEGERPHLAPMEESSSGAAEAYRTLRTNLRFMAAERPIRSLLVTSAIAAEGKTTVAANLSAVLAQAGTRTILVSGDLRRPALHKIFEVSDTPGLVDLLTDSSPLPSVLRSNSIDNLRMLTVGGLPPNPTEILASSGFGDLMLSLTSVADLVICDSPPVLGLADASVLASRVDGVLLVVDAHRSTRKNISHAAEQLRRAGGRILGTIMNAVEPDEGYGYYYQYYSYQYTSDEGKMKEPEPSK